jgi:hypothetical protein
MNRKNYAEEIIPYPTELVKDAEMLTKKKIINIPKYSFYELFTEIENKGKTEY